MTLHFTDQLAAAVTRCHNGVCVGLDPRFESLPETLQRQTTLADLPQVAQLYRQFCCEIIDVVAEKVPVVKPQAAFFEALGPAGMQALAEVIRYARHKNLLVILDGKRNDIGSTATAYAQGWLGSHSPWRADALTLSPYLGEDSLTPFVETAQARGAGLFVLVKTSNPGGGLLQDLVARDLPVYAHVAQLLERLSQQTLGSSGYGLAGAVAGATYPEQLAQLRQTMPSCWLLIPGFGSQGGTAADVAPGFDAQGRGAVVNNSRGIIFASERDPYRSRYAPLQWQRAVADAVDDMIDELSDAIPAPSAEPQG